MKKFLLFSLLTVFMMTAFSFDADAQRRRKKRKKKKKKPKTEQKSDYFDDSGFVHNLWYGADFEVPRFIGGQGQTIITLGLSPMVGYKFTDNFSLGPKLYLNNYHVKYANGAQDDIKFNSFNYGAGIFARYKILDSYFIHAEFEGISEEIVEDVNRIEIDPATNKILTVRSQSTHYYLGAGYTSGGNLAFNAYVLWDFSQQLTSTSIPIRGRVGVTYKF